MIYRIIKKQKMKAYVFPGQGAFNLGGLSSKLSFMEKILEELESIDTNILKKQDSLSVLIIFLIYYFFKSLQIKKNR